MTDNVRVSDIGTMMGLPCGKVVYCRNPRIRNVSYPIAKATAFGIYMGKSQNLGSYACMWWCFLYIGASFPYDTFLFAGSYDISLGVRAISGLYTLFCPVCTDYFSGGFTISPVVTMLIKVEIPAMVPLWASPGNS